MNNADLQVIDEALVEFAGDPKGFLQAFMPDIYTKDWCHVHDGIFEDFLDPNKKKSLILAPRGVGKSSVAEGIVEYCITYRLKKFILYVSSSATLAIQHTENIKSNLLGNELLRLRMGSIQDGSTITGLSDDFSKAAWVAYGNTLVMPRGMQQRVRGLVWRGKRPDLIICDDIEEAELIMNDEVRDKNRSWFLGSLVPCVRSYGQDEQALDYDILYIDTLKHFDALPTRLMIMPDWNSRVYSAFDYTTLESLIPQYMSTEEIQVLYETYAADGKLDVFFKEYGNNPGAEQVAAFKQSYFQYYDEADENLKFEEMTNLVIVDPAKTLNPSSCNSAVIGVSVDLMNKAIYVRQVHGVKVHPDELYELTVRTAREIGAHVIGLEVTSLNEFITYPFQAYLNSMSIRDLTIVELNPRKKKEDRITALIPFYRGKHIFHNKSVCRPLEIELMQFPASKTLDLADALAYSIQALDAGSKHFVDFHMDNVKVRYPQYQNLEKIYERLQQSQQEAIEVNTSYGIYTG